MLARKLKIPRIYVSANSGARIGLDREVRKYFKVKWVNDEQPTEGIEYLYLEKDNYQVLKNKSAVNCEEIKLEEGKMIYKILDVIGVENGIGVENLKGSGMIAGETSKTYEEIFTITLVTGRTVGIGSYLSRLGQRVIQNRGPILLTGAEALNKVLGKQVYVSNSQLGGPSIMYSNGVSHIDVNSDISAVNNILKWLSFVPKKIGANLPILPGNDPVERKVLFCPPEIGGYDPRFLLNGCQGENEWLGGLFDKDSFVETMGGWAKSVVCGRARLGGIPVGVIAVETRTTEVIIPADPARDGSKEQVIQQAGQVWFPDSSFKTATAIQDFNFGEELPLFILANWRGFSGGMSDMFNEVLKFGSLIVDNLRKYKQPIFIYLPPKAGSLF